MIRPRIFSFPLNWDIDGRGKVSDQEALFDTLDFLFNNSTWVYEHPEESKNIFSKLSRAQWSSTDIKTYDVLLKRYPELFPCHITFKLKNSDCEVQIPKDRLVALSPKFSRMLSGQLREAKDQQIVLDTEPYSESSMMAFFNFLKTGEIPEDVDLREQFYLANEHDVESLKLNCFELVKKNLKVDQIPGLLQAALDIHFPELGKFCCMRGLHYYNPEKNVLATVLEVLKTASYLRRDFVISKVEDKNHFLRNCIEYIQKGELEFLPEFIQISIDFQSEELLWKSLLFGLNYRKNFKKGQSDCRQYTVDPNYNPLKRIYDNLEIKGCSSEVSHIIFMLKEFSPNVCCKGLEFTKKKGKIEIYFSPKIDLKEILILNCISKFIPLTLSIYGVSSDRINDLLIIKNIKNLKGVNLRSLQGGICGSFITMEDVKNYIELGLPISTLDLKSVKVITDDDLLEISKKLSELEELIIHNSEITKIPFENLKKLDCRNCKGLKNLSLSSVKYIDIVGSGIENLSAPKAKKINVQEQSKVTYAVSKDCRIEKEYVYRECF